MKIQTLTLAAILTISIVTPAFAYVGPGAGLSAIGTLLAIVFAALLAVVGFVWYPLKRLFRGGKKPNTAPNAAEEPKA